MAKRTYARLTADRFSRREALALGAGLAAMPLLGARGASASVARAKQSSDPVDLVLWNLWGVSDAPDRLMQELSAGEWATNHPGSSLEVVAIPEQQYEARYTAAFAANQGPDLFSGKVDVYSQLGLAAPLPDDLAELYDAGLIDASKFYYTFNDVYHGVPFIPIGSLGLLLYYNVDHFAEAGLNPDEPPTTMSELREYARTLAQKDGNGTVTRSGFAHQISGSSANTGKFLPFLHAYGGRLYDSATLVADGYVNNPGGVEALAVLQDMTFGENAVDNLTLGSPEEQMARGQASMIFRESSFIGFFNERAPDLNFRISYVPPEVEEGCGSFTLNWCLMVNEQGGGKDAAFDFIREMANPEFDLLVAEAAGTVPAWRESWESPYMIGRPDYQALQYTAEHSPGIKYLALNQDEVNEVYANIMGAVTRGELEPQAAADQAAAEFTRVLAT